MTRKGWIIVGVVVLGVGGGIFGLVDWIHERLRRPIAIFDDGLGVVVWDRYGETTMHRMGHHGHYTVRKSGYWFKNRQFQWVNVPNPRSLNQAVGLGNSSFPIGAHLTNGPLDRVFVSDQGVVHKPEALGVERFYAHAVWKDRGLTQYVTKGGMLCTVPSHGPTKKVQIKSSALKEWGAVAVDEESRRFAVGRMTVMDVYDFEGRHLKQVKIPSLTQGIGFNFQHQKFYVIDHHFRLIWEDGKRFDPKVPKGSGSMAFVSAYVSRVALFSQGLHALTMEPWGNYSIISYKPGPDQTVKAFTP